MDMTLAEIRQKYPQYNDMDDETLAKRFHAKHASSTTFMDFAKSFLSKLSPISTAEAATAVDYSRGGTSARMQALQDAARDSNSVDIPRATTASETASQQQTSRPSGAELNARLDRLIAAQKANEAQSSGQKWKPKFKIPVKQMTRIIRDSKGNEIGEEVGFVDSKGKWYYDDPNQEN